MPQKDNTLEKGELILAVEIPENGYKKNVEYLKVRDRTSYAFALISVAAAADMQGGRMNNVRLGVGGVAHKPWRLTAAENFLNGKTASATVFGQAAQLAIQGAKGYGHNNFKLKLLPNTIIEALKIATGKS
jgi:xanthine dehydrogenase YagS FAD-binding subunit